MERIAIVVDSATDLSENLRKGHKIFEIPLQIVIDDASYVAGKNISGEEVFQAMENGSKVSSSLPIGEDIESVFEQIKQEGYTHAIVITVTSAMSGTYNVIKNFTETVEGLTIQVVDTLRISLGAGYVALKAEELVREGKSFDEILKYIEDNKFAANVYFTLKTLEYLRKGGRLGAVASTVANVLRIRPIISVSNEGVYYTVAKSRGYRSAIYQTIDAAYEFVKDLDKYRVVLLHADSKEDFTGILAYAKEKFDKVEEILIERISPALSVHSGREGFGLGVSRI
jgi:DegV family protein with EDD domain